jgi:predicted Zn-dependent peptidase
MCKEEPYGTALNGTLEDVNSLTKQKVADALKTIIEKSFVSVIVISDSEPHEFVEAFSNRISSVNRCYNPLPKNTVRAAGELRTQDEEMPVAQGKLVLGLRSCNTGTDRETIPTFVMTYLYGGGPSGKLFLNVREKLSLCYYCAARLFAIKGIVCVDSGVEFDTVEQAKNGILAQLDFIKKGEFDDNLISASKMGLKDSVKSAYDSNADLEGWYLTRIFDKEPLSPEEFVERIDKVTREEIIKAANTINLDTIYLLKGVEGVE